MLHMIFVGTVYSLALLTIAVLLWAGFTSGFALFDATDRFVYRASQGWLFNIIIVGKPLICGLMGFIVFRLPIAQLTRQLFVCTFAAIFLVSTLFGDKFLSLIVLVALYFSPFLALRLTVTRRVKAVATILISLVGITVSGLTYFTYSDFGRLDASQTNERLFGRFTGQGQLWYAANQDSEIFGLDQVQSDKLMTVVLAPKDADEIAFYTQTGIFYMVVRHAPDNIRDAVYDASGFVQFTGAGEAYLMEVYGHAAMLIIWAVLGFGCGIVSYWAYNSLITGSLPGYTFAMFAVASYASMINQGSFWQIFGVRALMYLFVMLAIDVGMRLMLTRRTRSSASAI